MQRYTGFDTTAIVRDTVLYSSSGALRIILVHKEITFRGGTFVPSLTIKTVVVILEKLTWLHKKKQFVTKQETKIQTK